MVRVIVILWVPFAAAITLLSFLTFAVTQQVLRQSANNPQIQIAEDFAAELERGQSVQSLLPAQTVDIARGLSPFVLFFDDDTHAVAASGLLDGRMPILPLGVFDYTRQHGEDRITWAPAPGVRCAVVMTRYGGTQPGFVVAGRSLREVENLIGRIKRLVLAGWLGSLAVSGIILYVCGIYLRRHRRMEPNPS